MAKTTTATIGISQNNKLPSTILHRKVEIFTKNTITSDVVYEDYRVEFHPLMTQIADKKAVISIGDNYYIKFTFPGANVGYSSTENDTVYATFCKSNIAYDDKYEDFVTSFPSAYEVKLINWLWSQIYPGTTPITGSYSYTMYLNAIGGTTNALVSVPLVFYFSIKKVAAFGTNSTITKS